MASNLSVSVTADSASLRADLAQATAVLNAFRSSLRDAANEAVKTGGVLSDSARASMLQFAAGVETASAKVRGIKSDLAAAEGGATAAALPFSTLTRETRALATELAAGNFLRAGSTLALIAEHIASLGAVTLGAIGGVTAFAGAIAYLTIEAIKSQAALDGVQRAMILAGQGASFSGEAVSEAAQAISTQFNISRTTATELIAEFARLPQASDDTRKSLIALALALADLNKEDPVKAAQELERAFVGDAQAALSLGRLLHALNAEDERRIQEAAASGDVDRVQAVLLDALNRKLGDQVGWLQQVVEWQKKVREEALAAGAMPGYVGTTDPTNGPRRPPGGAGTSSEQQQLIDAENRHNQILLERITLQRDIDTLQKAIAADTDDAVRKQHQAELADAQQRLQAINQRGQGSTLDQLRTELAQELSLSTTSHAQQLQETIAFWQRALAQQKLSATERLQVERDLAKAEIELRKQNISDAVASSEEQSRVEEATFATREEAIKAAYAQGKITLEQEHADFVALENQKYQVLLKGLNERLQLLTGDETAQNRVNSEILVAYQAHLRAMLALDADYAQKQKQLDQQQAQAWKNAVGEIESFESQMVTDILSKRVRLSSSLLQLSERLVASEIANDLKYLTNRLLVDAGLLAADEKAATGGILVNLLADKAKNTATITGEAGVGAAAAFADSAQLGPAGLAAAPGVAAATFGTIMGFDVSSAGGLWEVPRTMGALVHPQETIMPASVAAPMRDFFEGGGEGGGVTLNMNVSAIDARSFKAALRDPNSGLASVMREFVRNRSSDLRAALRS